MVGSFHTDEACEVCIFHVNANQKVNLAEEAQITFYVDSGQSPSLHTDVTAQWAHKQSGRDGRDVGYPRLH